MKKLAALLLAVVMVFSLTACGSKDDGNKGTTAAPAGDTTAAPAGDTTAAAGDETAASAETEGTTAPAAANGEGQT